MTGKPDEIEIEKRRSCRVAVLKSPARMPGRSSPSGRTAKYSLGAHDRNRTCDLFLTKEVLYRLSYMSGNCSHPAERRQPESATMPDTQKETAPTHPTPAPA